MLDERTCRHCGAPLLAGASDWHCPKCLFSQVAAATSSVRLTDPDPASTARILHYFGDYELLEEIARGGMGVVYKARQVSLNRIVAVKLLPFAGLATQEQVRRFRTEAEAAASLQHPNIVAIYEIGEHQGQQYFSMEYVDGCDLSAIVHDAPLSALRAATYVTTIAKAVYYAHERQTLHRDLKPSNVLIGADDEPRITDFGLAKRLVAEVSQAGVSPSGSLHSIGASQRPEPTDAPEGSTATAPQTGGSSPRREEGLTLSGQILGTPGFMPPEQATTGRGPVTVASDVYSIGAILYYLLTARPPFAAETFEKTLAQLLNDDPLAPRLLNPSIPRDLETICLKCLQKEPRRRYCSARELAEDLEAWRDLRPIKARPVPPLGRLWLQCRRKPALATASAIAALAIVFGVAGIGWQWNKAERAGRLAMKNFTNARMAVKRYLTLVASDPRLQQADLFSLRTNLLQTAVPFLEDFARQRSDDPSLEFERAETYQSLADLQRHLSNLPGAIANAETAKGILQSLAAVSPRARRYQEALAECEITLARTRYTSGDMREAESTFRSAIDRYQGLLLQYPTNAAFARAHARTLVELAGVFGDTGRLAEAGGLHFQAQTAFRTLTAADPDSLENKRELGWALRRQVDFLTRINSIEGETLRLASQTNELSLALRLAQELVQSQAARTEDHDLLASLWRSLGEAHSRLRHYADAEFALTNALSIDERLAREFPSVPSHAAHYAGDLGSLAGLYFSTGRTTAGEEAHQRSLSLLRSLAQRHTMNVGLSEQLAQTWFGMASYYQSRDRLPLARQLLEEARAVLEPVSGLSSDNVGSRRTLAGIYQALGGTLRDLAQPADAEAAYRKAIELLSLPIPLPDATFLRQDSANVQLALGRLLLSNTNRLDDAEAVLREVITLTQLVLTNSPGQPRARDQSGMALYRLAEVALIRGSLAEAETNFLKSILEYEGLLSAFPDDPGYLEHLGYSSSQLARLYFNARRNSESIAYWSRAVTAREKILVHIPNHLLALRNLAEDYHSLGNAHATAAKSLENKQAWLEFSRAREQLEESVRLRREILTVVKPTPAFRSDLARSLGSLAKVQGIMQDVGALTNYAEAIGIYEDLVRQDPTNTGARQHLDSLRQAETSLRDKLANPKSIPPRPQDDARAAQDEAEATLAGTRGAGLCRPSHDLHGQKLGELCLSWPVNGRLKTQGMIHCEA